LKLTQPVLIQSLSDEFDIPNVTERVRTPAPGGEVLYPGEQGTIESPEMQTKFRSGIGKMMHLMRWSRPEIKKCIQAMTKYMGRASLKHVKAMYRAMQYLINTPERGRLFKPKRFCDNERAFKFNVTGRSDSDHATDPETRRSTAGYSTFLEGCPVSDKCHFLNYVNLSVTESEYGAASECTQDMLFVMHLLESIGLQVDKPMTLEIDNKGAVDLSNNWSAGGRTRHIDVRHHFMRELKEDGIMQLKWISTHDNSSDLFTKNLDGPKFDKFTTVYCGEDEYMNGTG
jgi:hypothetical protein